MPSDTSPDLHVIPLNDLVEHDEHEDNCICGPAWERINGSNMYVHHSLDGREQRERPREG